MGILEDQGVGAGSATPGSRAEGDGLVPSGSASEGSRGGRFGREASCRSRLYRRALVTTARDPYAASMQITLESKTWTRGAPVDGGVGGFGSVFHVTDGQGNAAVAKFVPKKPGADRELLIGDAVTAAKSANIIPVLDSGEYGEQFVIVMPLASTSLAARMEAAEGLLPVEEVIEILTDIATALASIDGKVVHRDLKPQNVLLLNDSWCLADFGISRQAEASTAPDTWKFNLSRPYAAPEQWNLEHATGAADVYAFGVIGYQLLAGRLPFNGPDFRTQHLHETPPPLSDGPVRLRALIDECLYKVPTVRPRPANILARLKQASGAPATRGASLLAEANRVETARLATDYAEALRQKERDNNRAAMAKVAAQAFTPIWTALLEAIESDAPMANVTREGEQGRLEFMAQLRGGKIGIGRAVAAAPWSGPFEVISHSSISVVIDAPDRYGYSGRAHSLWFCDAQEQGRFAWYETAFMDNAIMGGGSGVAPRSLVPEEAGVAFANVMGTVQLAWALVEIDTADPSEFVDRWIGWFAEAAQGKLQRPSRMPEMSTHGTWRRD